KRRSMSMRSKKITADTSPASLPLCHPKNSTKSGLPPTGHECHGSIWVAFHY
ncbi:eukaryotic translation initiation factor, partial [Talaromyces pinophilus]